VDSGSVAAVGGWLLSSGLVDPVVLRAYSWAFSELVECDERAVSSIITEQYGLPTSLVPADDAWPLRDYPAHGPDRDEPFIGAFQALIERCLAIAQTEGMRVMLGGDRGDLVVGTTGLDYLWLLRRRRLQRLVQEIREHSAGTGESVPTILGRYLLARAVQTARSRSVPQWGRWLTERRHRDVSEDPPWPSWISGDVATEAGLWQRLEEAAPRPPVTGSRGLRYGLVFTGMHMRGAVWSNRTYARFGLVFADPFSDRRLTELVMAMPQAVITRPGDGEKRLARSALTSLVPERGRQALGKRLPRPLYDKGLLQSETVTVQQLLTNMRSETAGLVSGGQLRRHYTAALGGAPLRPEFWRALTTEMWLRDHFA
ncbi:MAG TPA: asparagine synthase-related protein, partial [Egibacteraceae bacterium]|nr:asparagine synthase-related protein [Egibacteraceae bacterium]